MVQNRFLNSPLLILASSLSLANAASYTSKGCYALSDLQSLLSSRGQYIWQTNSYCQQQCSGYAIAATLDGSTCYCGNSLPSNIQAVDSSNCGTVCQGFGTQMCGGNGYLSVYTDGSEDTNASGGSSSQGGSASASTAATSSSTSTSTSATASASASATSASTTSNSKTSTTSSAANTSQASSSQTSSSSSSSDAATSSASSAASSTTQAPQTQVITSVISASNTVITVTKSSEPTSSGSGSATSSSSGSATSTDSSSHGSSSLSKGAIAGIAIGSVVGGCALIGLIIFLILRARSTSDDDDEEDHVPSEKNRPPIHNDFNSFYGFEEPPAPVYMESGHKRLSNGSLPDARHEKTLRVVNPDETLNDTTLRHEVESDDDDWKFSR